MQDTEEDKTINTNNDEEQKQIDTNSNKEEKLTNINNEKEEKNNFKFHKLIPEILEEKSPYNEALDYALKNEDIKNIAISGIYGSGKTTIWESYVRQNNLENIITISLGNYKDISKENESVVENRVEKQLINQILVQINQDSIPLSKYKFKINNSEENVFLNTINTVLLIIGIFIWLSRKELTILNSIKNLDDDKKLLLMIIWGFIIAIPLFYFFNKFYSNSKFKLSKINVKGTEANFSEDKENDETILDKDIKELVYILSNSKTKIVVFEDLDRYDNLDIFTKLRELNFLVNKYNKTYHLKHTVKFIYMIKDELFDAKTRTKFFDFIIPIIPVINSSNSENMLLQLLKHIDKKPSDDVIFKISLYIDDMRLLKNIVNEFKIYSNIISIDELELNIDKLFAIIVLKNVCPKEFDDLQKNQGYIYEILNKTKEYYTLFLKNKINDKEKRINTLNNEIEFDEFELISLMLPSDVRCIRTDEPWVDILKKWYEDKEDSKEIKDGDTNYKYNYYQFIEKYIKVKDSKEISQKIKQDKEKEIEILKIEKKEINSKLEEIKLQAIKKILSNIPYNEKEQIFNDYIEQIENKNYLDFINFLILNGLVDETYYYYKEIFYQGYLGKNDKIYLKNLLEGKPQDVLLEVENPENIVKRLNENDFNRDNILNKNIVEYCLENNLNYILNIINKKLEENCEFYDGWWVDFITEKNYELIKFIKLLNNLKAKNLKKYVNILYNTLNEFLFNILGGFDNSKVQDIYNSISINLYDDILLNIYLIEDITKNNFYKFYLYFKQSENIEEPKLDKFNLYIEDNENIISRLEDEDIENFYKNIKLANVKFNDIQKLNDNKDAILKLQEIKAYKLNLDNVKCIVKVILGEDIEYGKLISKIYIDDNDDKLQYVKEYINENFDNFISLYINSLDEENKFANEENEVFMILNSNIKYELKVKYCENNKTEITDLSKINNLKSECDISNCLFKNDKIQFNSQNISTYWNLDKEYWGVEFVNFINKNIILTDNNSKDILENNIDVWNRLINDDNLYKETFDIILDFANEKIDKLDIELTEYKVCKIIDKDLLNISDENLQILLSNKYKEAITELFKKDGINIIDMLAKDVNLKEKIDLELIYTLANNSINEDYIIKLIELTKQKIFIENIPNDKTKIIKYVIDNNLSEQNKNYIIENFKNFNLKEYFLDKLEYINELSTLDNNMLNDDLMEYALKYDEIYLETKIDLIITKIRNHTESSKIQKYIQLVNQISKLSNIFNNGRLSIKDIGDYNKRIVDALVDYEYAKITKNDNLVFNKNIKL